MFFQHIFGSWNIHFIKKLKRPVNNRRVKNKMTNNRKNKQPHLKKKSENVFIFVIFFPMFSALRSSSSSLNEWMMQVFFKKKLKSSVELFRIHLILINVNAILRCNYIFSFVNLLWKVKLFAHKFNKLKTK